MAIEYAVALLVSIAVLAYLVAAMVMPDRFSRMRTAAAASRCATVQRVVEAMTIGAQLRSCSSWRP